MSQWEPFGHSADGLSSSQDTWYCNCSAVVQSPNIFLLERVQYYVVTLPRGKRKDGFSMVVISIITGISDKICLFLTIWLTILLKKSSGKLRKSEMAFLLETIWILFDKMHAVWVDVHSSQQNSVSVNFVFFADCVLLALANVGNQRLQTDSGILFLTLSVIYVLHVSWTTF